MAKQGILGQKCRIRRFWSQTKRVLVYRKILEINNFQGADFKYDNSFLKF